MDATIATFPTPLGWIAVVWTEELVTRLTFGHGSARSAVRASKHGLPADTQLTNSQRALIERLTAFAEGQPTDFSDVLIDIGMQTGFARRVLGQCRRILWGNTITYGELAGRSGSPRAARAVGNVMARSPIPLIIPCHRVVGCGGSPGGFSAPSGITLKKRLLALESGELSPV